MTTVVRRVLACVLWTLALVASQAHGKFLEPDQAFRFSATVDGDTIAVKYAIADGYYLYRERFRFALDPIASGGATLGEPVFPRGEIKYDETFEKDVEHYRKEVVVRVPLIGAHGPVALLSTSQGCADAGLCYPPQVARATLARAGPPAGASAAASSAAATATSSEPRAAPADSPSRIQQALASGNKGGIAVVFVGLGLLLAFTPCVLPMLPILSAILVGQASTGARRSRGFLLALAYSAGFAIVYTLLGIAAGLAGEGLAAALQAPWILTLFALLLVVLALSMFDVYTLQVPAGLQSRLARWSDTVGRGEGLGAGRIAGVVAMGALSALIVGPCVAAPLAGALVYISQTRDVFVGGLALFSLAVGMSVPLLLLGVSAGAVLPRAGAWMDTVKRFFGVLLLGVALWMITPIAPTWAVMLGWAILAIVAAVDLRVFDALATDAPGAARLAKGIGVMLLLAGAVEFVGLMTGGRDVLQPLAHLADRSKAVGTSAPSLGGTAPPFERIKSAAELDRRVATAGKPVLLDFYADWCVSCKEMERFTYTDTRVAARLKDFVLLQADVTANDADDRALLKRFALFGPPGIVFFTRDGRPLADASVIGYQDVERFLASLAVAAPAGT